MRLSRSPLVVSAGLMALSLVLGACGSSAPAPGASPVPGAPLNVQQPGAAPPSTQQQVKRGGTWVHSSTSSWAGSDPAMGQNAWQNWLWFGTFLIRREPATWELQGDVIEKWEFAPDGMEATLHLRKGVKWENKPPVNGREVEAKDVVYTLKSISGQQYPELPSLRFPRRSQVEDMADAVAVDKYTVKVKMLHPSSTFIEGLTDYRSPLTPDGIRDHFGGVDSLANPDPNRFLSAGPFTMEAFKDTVEAVWKRYPDYWEKGLDGQSKPYLDGVRMVWIADTGTRNAAFIAGQISSLALSNAETRDQVTNARKDAQIIQYEPNSCWQHITFNLTRKPFDDVRVRKALVLTLDPVVVGQTLYGDFQGKPVWRYAGPLPYPFPESLTQDELKNHPFWESPRSQKTIDEAKKLMAEAGYADGFSFEFLSGASTDQTQLYSNMINKVFPNIKIKLTPVDSAIQLERATKGDFDVRQYCYIHEPTAVSHMKTVYHSKGGRNYARLADAKMDELLDKAAVELNTEKRKQLLRDAQLRAMEVFSFWGTAHYISQDAFDPKARGMRLGGATSGLGMFSKELWFDQ